MLKYLLVIAALLAVVASDCNLDTRSPHEEELLKRIEPLKGKNYNTTNGDYTYYFAICDTPKAAKNKTANSSIIQEKLDKSQQFILGKLNDVDLEGGEYSIRMEYNDGDLYGTACNRTARSGVVLISCNYDLKEDKFMFIEENYHRGYDCGYIFELQTPAICPKRAEMTTTTNTTATTPSTTTVTCPPANGNTTEKAAPEDDKKSSSGLGAFSIILIVAFSILAVYFVVGTLYMRVVRNQRGVRMIPNFYIWNKVGNFNADLCDLLCRCGGRVYEDGAQPYESITGQASDDDNLLNV